ncbi:MAG: hypothetical protein FWG98_06925 [Candidatus Cloacimonetes bacterium]|nr:hypothetical protein [Candidatus Cloacimonadota bacterium]
MKTKNKDIGENIMETKEVIINDIVYVPKHETVERDGMKYCIVRTYSAGVFAGYVESREGKEAVIRDARRIWYWEGAASLSQLAMSGTSKPENCKFPEPMDKVTVTEAIEIIECSEQAMKSIQGVKIWKQ